MIVDMAPGHRFSPSKEKQAWQIAITITPSPERKTLASVCLSLLGATPLVVSVNVV